MPEASHVYKNMNNMVILRQAQYKSATSARSNKTRETIFYKPLNPLGSENGNKN